MPKLTARSQNKSMLMLVLFGGIIFACLGCSGLAIVDSALGIFPTMTPPIRVAVLNPPPVVTSSVTPAPTLTDTPKILATPTDAIVACPSPDAPRQLGAVLEIVDGVTSRVIINGLTYTVKYLGLIAPLPGTDFSEHAKQKNAEYTYSKIVTLVSGPVDKDADGTLLRYVYIGETFVNLELLKYGYVAWDRNALLDDYCMTPFETAADAALIAGAGMWIQDTSTKIINTPTSQIFVPPTSQIFVPPTSAVIIPIFTDSPPSSVSCCKHCGPNSKPCGNSCISLKYNCHKGSGCACW